MRRPLRPPPPILSLPILLSAFALASAAALPAAAAADAPKKTAAGKGGGPYLTKAELRACLDQQAKARHDDADLQKDKDDLAATRDRVEHEGETLKQQLATIDRTKAEAVAAYNQAAKTRDAEADAYQGRVTAFNKRIDAMKEARAATAKNCANRRYFEEDEAAIRKGK